MDITSTNHVNAYHAFVGDFQQLFALLQVVFMFCLFLFPLFLVFKLLCCFYLPK